MRIGFSNSKYRIFNQSQQIQVEREFHLKNVKLSHTNKLLSWLVQKNQESKLRDK